MQGIRTIKYNGKILAHIFKSNLTSDGVKFLTPESYSLQLGLLEHKKGVLLKSHQHNPELKYKVDTTQEFLYVEKGKVKVTYYSNDWKKVAAIILTKGDFLLHIDGGHGFEMLEKSRLIEVKQGPYPGDAKAKLFSEDLKIQ